MHRDSRLVPLKSQGTPSSKFLRAAVFAWECPFYSSMKTSGRRGQCICFLAGCSLGAFLMTVSTLPSRYASIYVPYGTFQWPFSSSVAKPWNSIDGVQDGKHLYIYEKNMKSGSTSWSQMLSDAGKDLDILPCWETNLLNALEANSYKLGDRDALMVCHVRRMSLSRERPARIISSFNLEKDMVISAFMEQKNLTIEQVDKNSTVFQDFKEGFKKTWQLE